MHDGIRDEFLTQFTRAASELTIGDPRDPGNFVGPLIEPALSARSLAVMLWPTALR